MKFKRGNCGALCDGNALFVFITDLEGCELSDEIIKKKRHASKRSLRIQILDESIEIHKGLPNLNRGSI